MEGLGPAVCTPDFRFDVNARPFEALCQRTEGFKENTEGHGIHLPVGLYREFDVLTELPDG